MSQPRECCEVTDHGGIVQCESPKARRSGATSHERRSEVRRPHRPGGSRPGVQQGGRQHSASLGNVIIVVDKVDTLVYAEYNE